MFHADILDHLTDGFGAVEDLSYLVHVLAMPHCDAARQFLRDYPVRNVPYPVTSQTCHWSLGIDDLANPSDLALDVRSG